MKDEDIARVTHAANSELRRQAGQSPATWEDLGPEQQAGIVKGVAFVRTYLRDGFPPTPEETHASWMKQKAADGWRHGKTQDPKKKTHPNMVPFAQLPASEQRKDALFIAIVCALLLESGGLASWSEKG